MENLVEIDNTTIASWQNDQDLLAKIPCLRTYKAPEKKVGCSKCAQKRCPGCAKQGYVAAKSCLKSLNPTQADYLRNRIQADQIRFLAPNERGIETKWTVRLGRSGS